MPHIRVRAIPEPVVAALSETLLPELAKSTDTPVEHFTLELVHTQFFAAGKSAAGYPFVEVLWFEREQVMQDHAAFEITRQIQQHLPDADVAVVFKTIARHRYYDNGEHY